MAFDPSPLARLAALGYALPPAPAAVGAYAAAVMTDGLLIVSGQLSRRADGTLIIGRIGAELSLEQGVEAARCSALNILAQAQTALGDLRRISATVRLNGHLQTAPDFNLHADVLNGASDLISAVLGEAGVHTRVAVGAHTLPLGVATEIDAIFAIRR